MSKPINPTPHGVLDYLLVVAFAAAPSVLNFGDNAATTSYIIAATLALVSLFTRYPLGLVKLIPFPVHGLLETVAAASLLVLPWLAGFSEHDAARNFFIVTGLGYLVVIALTNYRVVPQDTVHPGVPHDSGPHPAR